MSLTRRSFLASILAAGVAPAVVGSGILMPVRKIITAPSMDWVDNFVHSITINNGGGGGYQVGDTIRFVGDDRVYTVDKVYSDRGLLVPFYNLPARTLS